MPVYGDSKPSLLEDFSSYLKLEADPFALTMNKQSQQMQMSIDNQQETTANAPERGLDFLKINSLDFPGITKDSVFQLGSFFL